MNYYQQFSGTGDHECPLVPMIPVQKGLERFAGAEPAIRNTKNRCLLTAGTCTCPSTGKDSARDFVYSRFCKPFKKGECHVGVELEFPIINLEKGPNNPSIHRLLMKFLVSRHGFQPSAMDDGNKHIIGVRSSSGDIIQFEFSYNTLEFSMYREHSLVPMAERFFRYFGIVNEFLLSHRYMLSGLGVHPYRKSMGVNMLDNTRYRMMYEFTKFSGRHPGLYLYPGYLSFISAAHTHIDAPLVQVPGMLNFLSKLDWVKALLFSNSARICDGEIDMMEHSPVCWRDELMGNSLIASPEKGFGPYDTHFNDMEDVCGEILERPLWHVRREDNDYIIFNPVRIDAFVGQKIIHGNLCHRDGTVSATSFRPRVDDIRYLRSFRSVEVREFGTLESRSDCVQPVAESFTSAAFTLGIINNRQKIETLFAPYSYKNTAMRKLAVTTGTIPFFDNATLKTLLTGTLDLAREGLTGRGYGEESFLVPLYKRVERLTCPAKDNMALIKNGGTIEELVRVNARLN